MSIPFSIRASEKRKAHLMMTRLYLRRIHHHRHPLLAMRLLRAINPNRRRILDLHFERHGARPRAQGLETGEKSPGERVAGVRETALSDGVVFGKVAEGEGVADAGG